MSLALSVIAATPVVPEDSGGPYVAAAYVVFLVLIAVYVAIMAQRLGRISKQAAELQERLAHVQGAGAGAVQGDVHGSPSTGVPAAGATPARTDGDRSTVPS